MDGGLSRHLMRCIGNWMISLSYVMEEETVPPHLAPLCAPRQPHSTKQRLVEEEMIAHASHGHVLFRDDNSDLYHTLEDTMRGTS